MTTMRALILILLALCVPRLVQAQSPTDEITRGRYLATLGDCEVCHTAPGASGMSYAGGYPLHAYFGTVYSANITPDDVTGIGKWSSDQFYHAMHDGIGAKGHYLYPAFPYVYFSKLPRADTDALYLYLRTVKPRQYTPPPNRLIFPTNIRLAMAVWDWLFLDKSPLKPDPAKSAQWNRGALLVKGLGHCGGCHTPKTLLFTDKQDRYLQGGTIDGWFAPNLTGSRRGGLGEWTTADITTYLKTGSNRFGRVVGAMQDVIRFSTSHMSDSDRGAIVTYLKSLAPAPETASPGPASRSMQIGETVFVERCSVCHDADKTDYPSLAGNSVVRQPDTATLLRVILRGAQAAHIPGRPTGYSMPAFPTLTNAELAGVASYVRNSWGNKFGPVSEGHAAQIRNLLRPGG